MADYDPLGIINSETQIGPDGVTRRANEKVTRNYMLFGKYFTFITGTKNNLPKFLNDIDMHFLHCLS